MRDIIIVNCLVSDNIVRNIRKLGYEVFCCERNMLFSEPVSAHPDMNFLQIRDRLYVAEEQKRKFEELPNVKKSTNIFFAGNNNISPRDKLLYPADVYLNAVCICGDLICRVGSVYKPALEYAKSLSVNIVYVNQGYTKCNIAPVSQQHKAVITEDAGIAKILYKSGYDVLLLQKHEVNLDPYDYGFIGGACGLIENKLVFTGKIENHSEFKKIYYFCKKYNTEIISLSDDPLYDFGSILKVSL